MSPCCLFTLILRLIFFPSIAGDVCDFFKPWLPLLLPSYAICSHNSLPVAIPSPPMWSYSVSGLFLHWFFKCSYLSQISLWSDLKGDFVSLFFVLGIYWGIWNNSNRFCCNQLQFSTVTQREAGSLGSAHITELADIRLPMPWQQNSLE